GGKWPDLAVAADLVHVDGVVHPPGLRFYGLGGLPAFDRKLVGNHARARFEVLFQIRSQPLVGTREEKHGDHVGGAEINVQSVALHDSHAVFQAHRLDALGRDPAEVRPQLDSHGFGAELPRGGNHHPAVTAPQVVDDLSRLHVPGFEHSFHNYLWGG